jgi:hypothetical protein
VDLDEGSQHSDYDTSVYGLSLPELKNNPSKTRRQCQCQGGGGLMRQQYVGQRENELWPGHRSFVSLCPCHAVKYLWSWGVECERLVRSKHLALTCLSVVGVNDVRELQ